MTDRIETVKEEPRAISRIALAGAVAGAGAAIAIGAMQWFSLGGHLVSTLAGLALLKLTGPGAWAAAAGVGLAVLAMYLTGTFHPPAGINPLLVISNNLDIPVRAGAGRCAAADRLAYIWHRWVRGQLWPQRWL